MQTFLPYADFRASAEVLDDRRLGKQRVETLQVMRALTLPDYGWQHHPVTAMWRGYRPALMAYQEATCRVWAERGHADTCLEKTLLDLGRVPEDLAAYERGDVADAAVERRRGPARARTGRSSCRRHRSTTGALFPDVPDDLDYVWPGRRTAPLTPGRRDRHATGIHRAPSRRVTTSDRISTTSRSPSTARRATAAAVGRPRVSKRTTAHGTPRSSRTSWASTTACSATSRAAAGRTASGAVPGARAPTARVTRYEGMPTTLAGAGHRTRRGLQGNGRRSGGATSAHGGSRCAAGHDDRGNVAPRALAVNGDAVASLAAASAAAGAIMIQVSTDYVFDGLATAPYAEDAVPAPRTAYGRTKLAGERALLTALPDASYLVRTAWLYGAHGPNFVRTMIRLAAADVSPAVVDDQLGQPTWSLDVARQIRALVAGGAPSGVYHATSSGEATWYDLAAEVFRLAARARLPRGRTGRRRGRSPDADPDHQRKLPAPGAAARLQRARPRRLGGGGHLPHRRLARRPAPRLPGHARGPARLSGSVPGRRRWPG